MNLNITRRVALLGLASACAPLAALAADPYPTHPVRINGQQSGLKLRSSAGLERQQMADSC